MKRLTANKLPILAFGFAVLIGASVLDVSGQTRRRKRVSKPVPVATPLPVQSEPLVISRAEDFPDDSSRIVLPPAAQETIRTIEDPSARNIEELRARLSTLESIKSKDPDQKQKRLLLYIDILSKAETRAESLRKQLFDVIDKETTTRTRLDLIDSDIRPESIEKSVAMAGTLRPEELRDGRRKSLAAEKSNLQTLLTEISRTRTTIEQNLQRADLLVERLRVKLDKDIDDALADDVDEKP